MKRSDDLNQRAEYLHLIKDAVGAAYARRTLLGEPLSPCLLRDDRPPPDDLIKLKRLNAEIRRVCREMRAFERKHGFGIGVVLGDVPDSVRLATAILVAGAMTASARLDSIGDLALLTISGYDPVELLEILISFEGRGRLREHITMDEKGAANTGQCRHPALKENSVRAILGMTETDEVPSSLIETEERV